MKLSLFLLPLVCYQDVRTPMKPVLKSLRCVILSLAVISFSVHAGVAPNPLQVKTKFESGLRLTPDQLKTVLSLARRCGITNIASVESFRFIPVPIPRIRVESAEEKRGRRVLINVLNMKFSAWNDETEIHPKAKRLRGFWVDPPYVEIQISTLFKINGLLAKVYVDKVITIEVADKIMEAFAKKAVRFKSKSDERKFDGLVSEFVPTSLISEKEENRYRIRISNHVILFNLIGEQIVIEAVARVEV